MCIRFKHLYTHFEQHLLYTIRLCFSMQNWRTFAFSWYRNRRNRKKERYPNFKFRLQILNPFETQIKKRQEKGSVSRETELKKKILSCYTRTRIPVVSHSLYLKNTLWSQRYSFTPETVPCPSALRFRDWELLLHRKVIFGKNPGFSRKDAASPLARNRFLPQPL